MAFQAIPGSSADDTTSYIGSSGYDTIDLSGDGPAYVGAQKANDRISFSNGSGSVSTYTVKGGAGADRITTDGTTEINSTFINGNKDEDIITLQTATSSTISGGASADYIDAQQLNTSIINGNKSTDTINVFGSTTSTIRGGAGDDTTTLSGSYTTSQVHGDNDADTININNNVTLDSSTINGNAGADTINVNAITRFASSNIFGGSGADNINAATSAVGISAGGDAGTDQITASANADTVAGNDGADTINGGAGADTLTGEAGDDFFVFDAAGQVAAGETINGGNRAETLGDLINVTTAGQDFTNLGVTNLMVTNSSIERLRIDGAISATFDAGQLTGQAFNVNDNGAGNVTLDINNALAGTYDFTNLTFTATGAGSAFVDATDIIDIDVTAGVQTIITGTTYADSIDGNTAADTIDGGNGADTITGAGGLDSFTGGAGADSITGGGTRDTMSGGTGADNLRGGAGSDLFDATDSTTAGNAVTIRDFAAGGGADEIALNNTSTAGGFTACAALVNVAGIAGVTVDDVVADTAANLGVNAVSVGNQSARLTAGGFAIATDTGALYYDADGDFRTGVVAIGTNTVASGAFNAGDFRFGMA